MNYGTTNNVIIKEPAFGKTLTNGNAEIANYRVLVVTVSENRDGTTHKYTYPYIRGQTTYYLQYLNSYYRRVELSTSGNTISAKLRMAYSLDGEGVTTTNITVSSIRGVG